jgi:hypothetical protein
VIAVMNYFTSSALAGTNPPDLSGPGGREPVPIFIGRQSPPIA